MQDVNNRRKCVENIQEFFALFAIFFYTSKAVLKLKFIKDKLTTAQTKRAFLTVGQAIFF